MTANASVSSFSVYIINPVNLGSRDFVTNVLDGQATYNGLNALALVWVKEKGGASNAYVLQGY